jgi:hypothetical protein
MWKVLQSAGQTRHGCRWLSMAIDGGDGCQWLPMAAHACRCLFMPVHALSPELRSLPSAFSSSMRPRGELRTWVWCAELGVWCALSIWGRKACA